MSSQVDLLNTPMSPSWHYSTSYTHPLAAYIKLLACYLIIRLTIFPKLYKMQSQKTLDKRFTLFQKERYLERACDQIVLLNKKIHALQKRYKKAKEDKMRSFQHNMLLRLTVVEGVKNMYFEYACNIADEVVELRKELFGDTVQILTEPHTNDTSEWIGAP